MNSPVQRWLSEMSSQLGSCVLGWCRLVGVDMKHQHTLRIHKASLRVKTKALNNISHAPTKQFPTSRIRRSSVVVNLLGVVLKDSVIAVECVGVCTTYAMEMRIRRRLHCLLHNHSEYFGKIQCSVYLNIESVGYVST